MTASGSFVPRWFGAVVVLLSAYAADSQAQPSSAAPGTKPEKLWVFVGTYTQGKSQGIYRFELDLASGKLAARELAAETPNPSFLAITPDRRFLYAVSEVGNFKGNKSGAVGAFALDPKTGKLTTLNKQPSGGDGPCHVSVDRLGKHVLTANYGGGSVCVHPIQADGSLGEATAFIQHHGSVALPKRQGGPHAHSINLDAANRYVFAADLGLDKILIYRYDVKKGTLTPNEPPSASVAPGSGPRHFAFHPDGRHAYVINEINLTVTAFDYDAAQGVLKPIQTISTVREGGKGFSTAEVQVHPSGKFVYGSNRGHNSIAIFSVDPETGRLTSAGHQSHQIKTPRNFGIDPTGTYMLVANQDGNSIVVFRIDPKTGDLTPTGTVVEVPVPVCVKMIPVG